MLSNELFYMWNLSSLWIILEPRWYKLIVNLNVKLAVYFDYEEYPRQNLNSWEMKQIEAFFVLHRTPNAQIAFIYLFKTESVSNYFLVQQALQLGISARQGTECWSLWTSVFISYLTTSGNQVKYESFSSHNLNLYFIFSILSVFRFHSKIS